MNRPRRVLGYVRVSGAEQARHGTSLDEQQAEQRRWCSTQGHPDPLLYVEQESGAAGPEVRRELKRLLADARAGDLVIVTALDRWSRDLPWAVQSIRDLLKRGVGWFGLRESLDPSTDIGQMQLGYLAVGADQERRRTRERTITGRNAVARMGLWPYSNPPTGYRFAGPRKLEPDPETAPVVRWIFSQCIRGAGLVTMANEGRKLWPDWNWTQDRTRLTLRSRIYIGELKTCGAESAWVPGKHEPLVDRATWESAQAALDSRRGDGPPPAGAERSAALLLPGIARCGVCGRRCSASFGGPAGARGTGGRPYYVCAAKRKRRACTVEGYVYAVAADAEASEKAVARLLELRDELAQPAAGPAGDATADLERRRAALQRRRDRVVDLATDGALSREDLQRQLDRIEREAGALDLLAAETARARRAADPAVRARILGDVETIRRAWTRLDVAGRRRALSLLATRVVLTPGSPLVFEWRALEELAEGSSVA